MRSRRPARFCRASNGVGYMRCIVDAVSDGLDLARPVGSSMPLISIRSMSGRIPITEGRAWREPGAAEVW